MIFFNHHIFDQLREYKGITIATFCEDMGLKAEKYHRWKNGTHTITVLTAIKMCNLYHFDFCYLLSNEPITKGNKKQLKTYNSEDWKNIEFYPEKLYTLMESINYGIAKFISVIGISNPTLHNWAKEKSSMKLVDLLDLCNKFDISPEYFISSIGQNKSLNNTFKENAINESSSLTLIKDYESQIYELKLEIEKGKFELKYKDDEIQRLKDLNYTLRLKLLGNDNTYPTIAADSPISTNKKTKK